MVVGLCLVSQKFLSTNMNKHKMVDYNTMPVTLEATRL